MACVGRRNDSVVRAGTEAEMLESPTIPDVITTSKPVPEGRIDCGFEALVIYLGRDRLYATGWQAKIVQIFRKSAEKLDLAIEQSEKEMNNGLVPEECWVSIYCRKTRWNFLIGNHQTYFLMCNGREDPTLQL